MKIFIDANILVSVLNKEYPLFINSSRIISLADNTRFRLYTSPVCLAIAFYFSEKKSGAALAKKKIKILSQKINITSTDGKTVINSLENAAVNDFEDGLEYYSAMQSGCKCIVTEDIADFYFSKLEVLSCKTFIEKYLTV